jgi:hypothetical protein
VEGLGSVGAVKVGSPGPLIVLAWPPPGHRPTHVSDYCLK